MAPDPNAGATRLIGEAEPCPTGRAGDALGLDEGVGHAGSAFADPADMPRGGSLAPFGVEDAQPDLGDGAIIETHGLGGAMGRPRSEAVEAGTAMRRLFAARHPTAVLAGPLGLDAARVVAAKRPVHTGIARRDGSTGVGVAEAPPARVEAGLAAWAA